MIVEDEIYLIIRIGKIANFNVPNFVKLPVSVYISVEWVSRILLHRMEKLMKQGNY